MYIIVYTYTQNINKLSSEPSDVRTKPQALLNLAKVCVYNRVYIIIYIYIIMYTYIYIILYIIIYIHNCILLMQLEQWPSFISIYNVRKL